MKNITTLLIDLDGTVYSKHNGLWEEMTLRIDSYMHGRLGIPKAEIEPLRNRLYRQYGSTLRGLQSLFSLNPAHYLEYVHDLPLHDYLAPDPELRAALEALPQPKWIFTNSDHLHSQRVLSLLGLEDLFEGILDVWAMDFIPKPDPLVYRRALQLVGNVPARQCLFADDTIKNLTPARHMGLTTAWVGETATHPSASFSLETLHQLPELLPILVK